MAKRVVAQRRWRRRAVPVAVTVLVAGGIAGTRAFASGSDGPTYRLARVSRGTVDQTLTLAGIVRKVSQVSTAFKVAGTVHTVPVRVGDQVTAGQTLATLDSTALRRALIAAEATLAEAKATLAADEGSSASNVDYDRFTASSSEVFAVNTALVVSTRPPKTPAEAAAAVQKAQTAVTAALAAAASALTTVTKAQDTQTTTCAPVLAGTATTAEVAACAQAVQTTSSAQADAATAQTTLAKAQASLSAALTTQAKILASSGSSGGSGSGGSGSSGSGSGGTGGSGSSPERVASDKAAVTSAQTALATAQANLAQATLSAPISGTVAAVGYTPGAPSGSNSITIVGPGAVDVTVDVPLASLPKVKVGQPATVTSAGSATPVAGTVRSISLLPASSSSTSVSYPVVVRVADPTPALASGSTATATITLATAKDVLTVPNSALTSLAAGTAVVTVVNGGTATRALIRTGAVGATTTQVLSGLTEGQQVAIADLSEALPTSSGLGSNRLANRSGLTSGLTGAGEVDGGFGGGGPKVFVNGGPPPG